MMTKRTQQTLFGVVAGTTRAQTVPSLSTLQATCLVILFTNLELGDFHHPFFKSFFQKKTNISG
jgi:hypothetical protein